MLDLAALFCVLPEHGGGLVTQYVPLDGDATLFEHVYPLRRLRSFVEADRFSVLAAGAAHSRLLVDTRNATKGVTNPTARIVRL